jgi:ELWxxDGT repeat protein
MALDETTGTVSIDTTHMVKDINSGSKGARLSELTGVGGEFFFVADNGGSGRELWTSDGTPDGTEMIRDIRPGEEGAIAPGGIGSHSGWFTAVEGVLFFAANDGENGYELWKSDGTASGTEMVEDIRPGPEGSRPGGLTDVGGALFFAAADSSHGLELWRSDGTAEGTFMVKDLTGDSAGSAPDGLTNVGGVLYFAGNDRVHGWELWKSDGTAGGTTLVKDIRKGSDSSFPAELTPFGDSLAFRADDGTIGAELWGSGGDSSSTRRIEDIAPGGTGSVPRHLTKLGGELFFSTNDQTHGRELWRSNGEGTEMVEDIYSGSLSSISRIYRAGGQLFFAASDGESGSEPWVSDGTTKGTRLVTDLRSGPAGSRPRFFTEIGGKVLFSATDGLEDDKHGRELWRTATLPLVNFNLAIPAGTEGSGEPASTVMRGGEFARYYRLKDGDGELYTASDSVTIHLKNGRAVSPDKNGLVRISGSTKKDEAFSEIRGASAEALPGTVKLNPVDNVVIGRETVTETSLTFDVKVRERKWRHTWERTEAFSSSAGAVLLMKGKSDGTVAFTRNEDALKIHALFRLGGGLGFSFTAFELELGVLNAGCGVGGAGIGLKGSGNTHRFKSPLTKEPDNPTKEKTGLVLLSALVQQSVQASPAFFLRHLIPKLARELGFSAKDHLVRSSSTWGVEAEASAGCGASLGVPVEVKHGRRGGAASAGFNLANASASLGSSFTSFDRVLTNRRPVDLQETGFKTSIKRSFNVDVLGSLLETLNADPSSTTKHTVSMKTVRSLDNTAKTVVSSLGLKENGKEQTMRLILDREALQTVANHVDQDDLISPVIKNFRGTLERGVLDWGIDWGKGSRFETMKTQIYDKLLKTLQKRAVDARLDYEVVRTRSDPRGGITVPVSASAGLAEIGFEWKYDRTFREKWLKEGGVIYCPDVQSGSDQTCRFEKQSDDNKSRSPVYWTRRYENDRYIDAPGQGLKSISEELLKSLEDLLKKHHGIWYDIADVLITPFEDKKKSSLAARKASLEIGPENLSEDRGETKVTLVGWEGEGGVGNTRESQKLRPVSQMYQLFPGEIKLKNPATLTIGYSEDSLSTDVDEKGLDIYRADLERGRWVATGGMVDVNSNEIEAEVTRFAPYTIAPDRAPHAPPRLEVEPDTVGNVSVRLDWSVPEVKDLAGYYVYRSDSKGGTSTRLNGSLLSKSTFIDEDVHLDSTYFYTATAVDTAGNESPRPEAVGGALRSVQGTASARVHTGDEFDFGPTGVDIRFPAVTGAGQVRVTKLEGPPEDTTGLSRVNVSAYRYVIESEEGLSVGDSTEVRLDVSTLRGVGDPDTVTVYRRPLTGVGQLMALPTAYDSTAGDLVAQTGSFGEFVLGSNDVDNPLPVEMAGFEAQLDEGRVQLTWQTASEVNNTGFQVQRRHRGIDRWRSLGFVESKASGGTTTTPVSYQFTDRVLPYEADSLFYRLRQVDADGTSKLSDRVEVALSTPDEVQLHAPFPNPAQGQATVRLALPERQTVTLRLYDVLGRRVATVQDGPMAAGRSQLSLDLSSLSSGVYLLRLESDAVTQTRKLTIVR